MVISRRYVINMSCTAVVNNVKEMNDEISSARAIINNTLIALFIG